MRSRLAEIEPIGPALAERLRAAEIESVDDLVSRCGDALGRQAIAAVTGIPTGSLLRWVRLADLMRVAGVDCQYAELLLAAGIEDLWQLGRSAVEGLRERLGTTNQREQIAMTTPSIAVIEDWIRQAGCLSPRVSR